MSSAAGDDLVAALAGFCRALRAEGMVVGTHDLMTLCETMGPLDPTDMTDLYYGGQTALVHRREDLATYHRVFRSYFLYPGNPVAKLVKVRAHADAPREESVVAFEVPATEPPADDPKQEETALGLMASNVATLRNKSFADCTNAERDALRRIMRRVRLNPPLRRTRRTRPGTGGPQLDLRRTVSGALHTQGELLHLSWRRRRVKPRPVVLILDISGSMADHSRSLLQFAWGTRRVNQRVEVFAFGTRLSYLTKALNTRSLDDAMDRAAREVLDWEGGTRIGAAIVEFVARWGRRGMARGAIVVICSDGFDRGDPETLAEGMEKLARLAHQVVWLTPHHDSGTDFTPTSLGMMVAAPHVDVFGSCHDLAGLERFAVQLPTLA